MSNFTRILATELPNHNTNLDAGYLAELLLFYKHVNIVINKLMLNSLFEFCDVDTLFELVSSGRLNIYIFENYIGGTKFDGEKYNVETFKIQNESYKNILYVAIQQRLHNSTKTLKYLDKLLGYIKPYEIPNELIPQIREEFKNIDFVHKCLDTCIKHQIPGYKLPKDTYLKFVESEPINDRETFHLETNFNFEETNVAYKQLGLEFRINPPSLLLSISLSLIDLNLANNFNSNILSSSLNSTLISNKFDDIKVKDPKIIKDIELFQEIVLPTYNNIGDVIRSKSKTFADYLPVLDKAEKFKHWLDDIEGTPTIINDYYKKISEKSWIETTPAKTARFLFFTGAGLFGDLLTGVPVTSPIFSAIDNFLLSKIAQGWKPNQFVDNDLKDFLK